MLPDGFIARMRRLLGAEFDAFFASYELPRNTGIRLNPRKAAWPLPFCGEQIPWEPNGYYYDAASRPGLHPLHEHHRHHRGARDRQAQRGQVVLAARRLVQQRLEDRRRAGQVGISRPSPARIR